MEKSVQTSKSYRVTLIREDESHAMAETRGHTLTLNVKKGDGAAGFNAAETLLAALGACLINNINSLTAKMHLQVDHVCVEIEGLRRDEPPGIFEIHYRLILDSPEPEERLERLHELAFKWGTVTNTLLNGVTPQGEWVRRPMP